MHRSGTSLCAVFAKPWAAFAAIFCHLLRDGWVQESADLVALNEAWLAVAGQLGMPPGLYILDVNVPIVIDALASQEKHVAYYSPGASLQLKVVV